MAFVVLALRSCVFEIVRVKDDTLLPTLQAGDLVFIDKMAYGLRIPGAGNYVWQWRKPEINQLVLTSDWGDPPLAVIRRVLSMGRPNSEISAPKNIELSEDVFALGIPGPEGTIVHSRGKAVLKNLAGVARFVLFPREKRLNFSWGSIAKPIL